MRGEIGISDIEPKHCQDNLDWILRRIQALDQIECKLRQMRELACYAASRHLREREAAQVQEWVDILYEEAVRIDQSTSLGDSVLGSDLDNILS